ncbi:kama family protein [Lentithecium fluviatile CBS 122367]|uniref:Kama family protein n=1 Tax=Lentithecium fluviatile CBS 122367 TaxID=1168545 RepID=A0A6G1JH09_9PLEO|nr:kama family protein [Lentithecium fluviatile CBS 122367]
MAGVSLLKAMPIRRTSFSPRLIQSTRHIRAQSSWSKEDRYWSNISSWRDTSPEEFITQRFQSRHTINTVRELERFLSDVLPENLAPSRSLCHQHIKTKEDFIEDATQGLKKAPMAMKLTPHVLSRMNWQNPLDDPVRNQFLPLKSGLIVDHPELTLDSLHEEGDSPVPGLVHRYPGRALFLATSTCPVYCRFCTRSWAVGADTEIVSKTSQKLSPSRLERIFQHIESDKTIQDIVVSGGDSYLLAPDLLSKIGERLLNIPHVRRFRLASKGLAVAPGRILDEKDGWAQALIALSKRGREMGKQVCLHTHFNHPNEITWITRMAANKLFKEGVIVRNQTVLLKGVNDDNETMGELIKELADINIQPYYVYQCDLVRGTEDLRTPLRKMLEMDKYLRGTISGFMMPSFVVDLPGGGGKRLASTYEHYDEVNGVSYWRAPGLPGEKGKQVYTYYDPYPTWLSAEEIKIRHQQTKQVVEEEVCRIRQEIEAREGVKRDAGTSSAAPASAATDIPSSHPTPHSGGLPFEVASPQGDGPVASRA